MCVCSFRAQATAQCGHEAEAAGGLVLAGSVLLPPSQALHPGRDGGAGKPRVQQQEDRAYPKYRPNMWLIHGFIGLLGCEMTLHLQDVTLLPFYEVHVFQTNPSLN